MCGCLVNFRNKNKACIGSDMSILFLETRRPSIFKILVMLLSRIFITVYIVMFIRNCVREMNAKVSFVVVDQDCNFKNIY